MDIKIKPITSSIVDLRLANCSVGKACHEDITRRQQNTAYQAGICQALESMEATRKAQASQAEHEGLTEDLKKRRTISESTSSLNGQNHYKEMAQNPWR